MVRSAGLTGKRETRRLVHHVAMYRAIPILLLLSLTACRSLEPRPAASSYSCMRAVRDQVVQRLGQNTLDKRLHCAVSAHIARQCSVSEAYLAGMGKEVSDLFTGGDAEWADWQADRAGVSCGKANADEQGIAGCCAERGY